MKLWQKMAQDRAERSQKAEQRNVPAAAEIVKEIPRGWFTILQGGKHSLAFNHASFGLLIGVRSPLTVGGLTFVRNESVPLPVWNQPAPVMACAYGNFERNGVQVLDSEQCGFDGNFQVDLMK